MDSFFNPTRVGRNTKWFEVGPVRYSHFPCKFQWDFPLANILLRIVRKKRKEKINKLKTKYEIIMFYNLYLSYSLKKMNISAFPKKKEAEQ